MSMFMMLTLLAAQEAPVSFKTLFLTVFDVQDTVSLA